MLEETRVPRDLRRFCGCAEILRMCGDFADGMGGKHPESWEEYENFDCGG